MGWVDRRDLETRFFKNRVSGIPNPQSLIYYL